MSFWKELLGGGSKSTPAEQSAAALDAMAPYMAELGRGCKILDGPEERAEKMVAGTREKRKYALIAGTFPSDVPVGCGERTRVEPSARVGGPATKHKGRYAALLRPRIASRLGSIVGIIVFGQKAKVFGIDIVAEVGVA